MDRELLLEIGVEEMPASWLPVLTAQLAERMRARLADIGLKVPGSVEGFSTPRRLTVVVPELIDRQEDRDEKLMGPPVSAGMTPDGHPTPAVLGFARKNEVGFDALTQEDTPKGRYFVFLKKHRGHATVDVLPDVLTKVLRDLTFPKQMRWDAQIEDGKGEFTFGRPVRWLLYLYGGRVVPFTIARTALASSPRVQDVSSGAVTYGHRFLATSGRAGRAIKVRSFDEYKKKLGEQFVILTRSDRRDRIIRDLDAQSRRIGGRVMIQQHPQTQRLIDEVPDLVEYPAVVAGAFGAEFLQLPPEVLTTTLIHHQHFFPVIGQNGKIMPAFLAVTNTQAANDRGIATNAERVVTARLRDARFFWDADRKIGLEARLERLETVLFHKQLGSYRAKAERIEALARWIAKTVFAASDEVAGQAARAAKLCKADLATDMVREFPELQGQMGGVYAREAQEPEEVWKAIYYHYLPIAVEADAAPAAEHLGKAAVTWACVSLADKLDTVVGLFKAGEKPTGSRDPFGIRRAAQGIVRILVDVEKLTGQRVRVSLQSLFNAAAGGFSLDEGALGTLWLEAMPFLNERVVYVLETRGFDRRNVRAVLATLAAEGSRPILDAVENLKVLPEFSASDQFRQLATAFKRVRNIAKEQDSTAPGSSTPPDLRTRLTDPAEIALLDEIEQREGAIHNAARTGTGYRDAYVAAAGFEPLVARFFKDVMVMAEDPVVRQARLHLVNRLATLILQLGDISEIVATES